MGQESGSGVMRAAGGEGAVGNLATACEPDGGPLRDLIARHLNGIGVYARELRAMLDKLAYKVERSRTALRDGESVDNLYSFFAADLDMVASRLARKCERYEALVDAAYEARHPEAATDCQVIS